MLKKCGIDFNFFYLASTNLEVWGSQFKSLSHNPSSSNPNYQSLSPILRKECRIRFFVIPSGEKFEVGDSDWRLRVFVGQRRSVSEQLQTQW